MTSRTAEISRKTRETEITVRLDLDGAGAAKVATGIGLAVGSFPPQANTTKLRPTIIRNMFDDGLIIGASSESHSPQVRNQSRLPILHGLRQAAMEEGFLPGAHGHC